jgi:hypothetical protein
VTPESTILMINLVIVLTAYLWVYPRWAGLDLKKVALNDVFASAVALFIAGFLYMGSGVAFTAFGISVNWFWFSLLSYVLIEMPFVLWYFRKALSQIV